MERKRDNNENKEELLKVLEHPATTMIGHPKDKILQNREGYEVNIYRIIDTMANHIQDGRFNVLEWNASPYGLDIDYRLCKYAKFSGVPVTISPDAHSNKDLVDIQYGVMTTRKGWLKEDCVLNTMSGESLAWQLTLQ